MASSRVFSGIQATGIPHLGNYLGALRHWADMQSQAECIYGIMDLHAITVPQEPAALRENTRRAAAAAIACGVDPEKHILFVQSQVAAHAQLGWILGCFTPLGWLNRMTQFKDKAGKNRESCGLGLYAYPVLQAADILLYKATHVPVGEDQKQHIELARDIAGAFNRAVGQEFFTLPEPVIVGETTRVMSLRDGTKKMSKSDASDYARINLDDDDELIALKIRKAKTDSFPEVTYVPDERPEVANLMEIYAALRGQEVKNVLPELEGKGTAEFKSLVADALVIHLAPVRERMHRLLADPDTLDRFLAQGAARAGEIAYPVLQEVMDMVGFYGAKR